MRRGGFTIIELLIVVVIVAILSALVFVVYSGIQRQTAASQALSTAKEAGKAIEMQIARGAITSTVFDLPSQFKPSSEVSVELVPVSSRGYSDLSSVQNGALFHEICEQLVQAERYSVIRSANGAQSQSVIMSCNNNIQDDALQITGWDSITWGTPLNKSQVEQYIDTVPYDSWWTNRQDVVRGFYRALLSLYASSGGEWPITSFWDPWANQWSGVAKENLPEPDINRGQVAYCVEVTSKRYIDIKYRLVSGDGDPKVGSCLDAV